MKLAAMTDQQLRDHLAEIDDGNPKPVNGYADHIENEIFRRWPRLELLTNWTKISFERDQEDYFQQHPDARDDVMKWMDAPDSELTVALQAALKAVRWNLLYDDDTLLRQRPGWTQDECAEHCGITPSTWRSYVARYPLPLEPLGHDFRTGAVLWDADLIRMWQILRPGQGARTELQAKDENAGTDIGGFGRFTTYHTPKDFVLAFLGDKSASFNVDGLVDAYRNAINAGLADSGITLNGRLFIGPYPVPADAEELIDAALEAVDLGELAASYDTTEEQQ